MDNLYQSDFYRWREEQKQHLINRQFDQLDLEHLIAEVDDMGSELDTLESRLTTLLMHLLKYQHQTRVINPVLPEAYNCRDWQVTILEQRAQIHRLLTKRPHLKSLAQPSLEEVWPASKKLAIKAMNLYVLPYQKLNNDSFPEQCPWTFGQVMEDDWLP